MDEKQIIMRLREIEKHYIRGGDEKFDEERRQALEYVIRIMELRLSPFLYNFDYSPITAKYETYIRNEINKHAQYVARGMHDKLSWDLKQAHVNGYKQGYCDATIDVDNPPKVAYKTNGVFGMVCCENCRMIIDEGDRFCKWCGSKIIGRKKGQNV